jgi:hypothetical protein
MTVRRWESEEPLSQTDTEAGLQQTHHGLCREQHKVRCKQSGFQFAQHMLFPLFASPLRFSQALSWAIPEQLGMFTSPQDNRRWMLVEISW